MGVLRRIVRDSGPQMSDWAAELNYYALLEVSPR